MVNLETRSLFPKSVFDETQLLSDLDTLGISHVHAKRIWRLLIQNKNTTTLNHIQNIPKQLINLLNKDYQITTSTVIKRSDAKDQSTTKLLIQLQDGKQIEACIMRYGHVELDNYPEADRKFDKNGNPLFRSNKRATLCVSSQVGCAMGCTFCATGTMGLVANLTSGEILEQLYHASKVEKINGIVFMGMGEPLDNYHQVIKSINAMTDTARFGLSASKISVSTVGVVPRIRSLKVDCPLVGLCLSLHAPNMDLRLQIVPTTKAWSIEKILKACDEFIDNQNIGIKNPNKRRHVLIEYVLIDGVNDSEDVAHQMGVLLKDREVLLNVIPYNVTAVPYDYKPPSIKAQTKFVEITRSYGIRTILRQTMGSDINSACGQLVIESSGVVKKAKTSCVADMEDMMGGGKKEVVVVKKRGKTAAGNSGNIGGRREKKQIVGKSFVEFLPILAGGILAVVAMRILRKLL